MENNIKGAIGESQTISFLKNKGYGIIATNFKSYVGEIDIIAKQGESLVFIEVKSRASMKFGLPREAVTTQKQRKIRKTAEYFLLKNQMIDSPCRFDVIEVLDGEITHLIDAF